MPRLGLKDIENSRKDTYQSVEKIRRKKPKKNENIDAKTKSKRK